MDEWFDAGEDGDLVEAFRADETSVEMPPKTWSISPLNPANPSEIGYPPTVPVEVALQTAPDDQIREAYGYTPLQWSALKRSDQFKRDLKETRDMLRTEGMSFRAKARLQAEELLATSWRMIHDNAMPATVRADLLKFTVRAAGLEAKSQEGQTGVTPLQIQINLG